MNLKVFCYKKEKRYWSIKTFFSLIFIILIYIITQRSDFEGLKNIILSGDGQDLEDEELLNYYINRENKEVNDNEQVNNFWLIERLKMRPLKNFML